MVKGWFGVEYEQEQVPAKKAYMFSTRDNSEYKWQTCKHVIGALEVPSDPSFQIDAEYAVRHVKDHEDAFDDAVQVWDDMKLRDELIRAVEGAPKEFLCCGLVPDDDGTIKKLVRTLNKGWIKDVNQRLHLGQFPFRIDAFLWQWHNATGKSETNILIIRFMELTGGGSCHHEDYFEHHGHVHAHSPSAEPK